MPRFPHSLRRIARGVAVWFAWFLLTGYVTHDRSYGELRRLDRRVIVRQVALICLTVAVLGWVAFNIPPDAAAWLASGLLLSGAIGGFIVGSYFAVTWYADYSLAE